MRILHVITGMQKAAGTSVFCGEVANGLVAAGHDVVIAVANPESANSYPVDSRVELISVVSLLRSPAPSLPHFDLIHIHALWSPLLHRVSKWAKKNGIPVVWSPHGMLQKWALKNKWWKKLVALALYQWLDLKNADLLHATAQTEVEDIRRLHLGNTIVVAPLGVKVDDGTDRINHEDGSKVLLFVSRVQRKKGLPVLIDAWAKLPIETTTGWKVRIVGPDQDNHTAELKKQCERLGVIDSFSFVGPKYGTELDDEYRKADLFVLPTHSENFGSVVVEALAHRVPVICSQGAPWKELEEYCCGWWPSDSVEALSATLQNALSCNHNELQSMGERGRKLVEEKYTWGAVVKKMVEGYEGVVRG